MKAGFEHGTISNGDECGKAVARKEVRQKVSNCSREVCIQSG